MKRFDIITEADARALPRGEPVMLTRGGHVTPLAHDTLRERRIEVVRLQPEVGRGNRRGEAIVERLGQMQSLVGAVPAELDRQLVRPQLAGMEEAEQLDAQKVGVAEFAELGGTVLVDVPGVVRLFRPGRGEREQVGRREVGDATRSQHRLEVLKDRPCVLDVLDRL